MILHWSLWGLQTLLDEVLLIPGCISDVRSKTLLMILLQGEILGSTFSSWVLRLAGSFSSNIGIGTTEPVFVPFAQYRAPGRVVWCWTPCVLFVRMVKY
jgi:hypothetical protein